MVTIKKRKRNSSSLDFIWKEDALEYKRKQLADSIDSINDQIDSFFNNQDLSRYGMKYREGQVNMAMDIVEAIRDNQHLIIEAGVGIGKTFAYLIPMIYLNQIIKQQMIIATSTIALQEQLEYDAENLQTILGTSIEITVAKGQNNYLCKDKLEGRTDSEPYKTISIEAKQGRYGIYDRNKFTVKVSDDVWDEIKIQEFNQKYCGGKCKHFARCYYYNQRIMLQESSGIVICNQDLLTAHFQNGKRIFNGKIGIIVVDEAHNLESKVRNALTKELTEKSIIHHLRESRRSLPRGTNIGYQMQNVEDELEQIFKKISNDCNDQDRENKQRDDIERYTVNRDSCWESSIKVLFTNLKKINDLISLGLGNEDRVTRDSVAKASEAISMYVDLFQRLYEVPDDFVYWAEKTRKGVVSLFVCPRKDGISNWINENYFPKEGHKSILTSATLRNSSVGEPLEQYSYLTENIGFPKNNKGVICEAQESPFNYDDNAIVYIAEGLPHPTRQHDAYIERGIEEIVELLKLTKGRSLILFTAKSDLNEVYRHLIESKLPFKIMREGGGRSHSQVLRDFKADINSVLLGTGSYWEGVDVKGEALTNLIVFRLPFPVPDPIINDKCARSSDKLNEILVPEMIIRLKQGIGRLIRSENDKGIISIIDPRLAESSEAPYKDIVFSSLPIHNRTSDLRVVAEFFNRIEKEKEINRS